MSFFFFYLLWSFDLRGQWEIESLTLTPVVAFLSISLSLTRLLFSRTPWADIDAYARWFGLLVSCGVLCGFSPIVILTFERLREQLFLADVSYLPISLAPSGTLKDISCQSWWHMYVFRRWTLRNTSVVPSFAVSLLFMVCSSQRWRLCLAKLASSFWCLHRLHLSSVPFLWRSALKPFPIFEGQAVCCLPVRSIPCSMYTDALGLRSADAWQFPGACLLFSSPPFLKKHLQIMVTWTLGRKCLLLYRKHAHAYSVIDDRECFCFWSVWLLWKSTNTQKAELDPAVCGKLVTQGKAWCLLCGTLLAP